MYEKTSLRLLILLILFLFSIKLIPEPFPINDLKQQIVFKRLKTVDGIFQGRVVSIVQDSIGFLWFGTDKGLYRYDGRQIRSYRHDRYNNHSLSSNDILKILIGRNGILWVITIDSILHRYDPEKDRFERISLQLKDNIYRRNFVKIVEDKQGKLWVGTRLDGLISYDPKTGIISSYKSRLNKYGKNIRIFKIAIDRKNRVWIGTDHSLFRLDQSKDSLFQYPFRPFGQTGPGDPVKLNSPYVSAIHIDRQDRIWIGTYFGGLQRLDTVENRFISYPFSMTEKNRLYGNTAAFIFEGSRGKLWISGRPYNLNFTFKIPRFSLFDPKTEEVTRFDSNPQKPGSISQNNVLKIFEDSRGLIWLHTFGGGIDILERRTKRFTHFNHDPKDPTSLGSKQIYTFFEDSAGTIWIGTDSGISYYHPMWRKFRSRRLLVKAPYRESNQSVIRILGSNIGRNEAGLLRHVWLGTEAGLNRWDRQKNRFHFFEVTPKTPDSQPYALYEAPNQILWVGTGMGLHRSIPISGSNPSIPVRFETVLPRITGGRGVITAILPAIDGNLWIASYGLGLGYYNTTSNTVRYFSPEAEVKSESALSRNLIITMVRGNRNRIWIISKDGLGQFNPKTRQFIANDKLSKQLAPYRIQSLHQSHSGVLWLGTMENGLLKYDPQQDKLTCYSKQQGMPSNRIQSIISESDNHRNEILWISTERGLSRFHSQTDQFDNFFASDGLQGNEFNYGSVFRSDKGKIFFGGKNGFNIFMPNEIRKSRFTPPLMITELKVLNRSVHPGQASLLKKVIHLTDHIRLSHSDKIISFRFSALHYPSPENIQYAYYLEGLEKDWNYCENRNFTTYSSLPPGDYRFHIKSSNCDGVWNDAVTTLRITVSPPFWGSWWFKMILIILFMVLLVASIIQIKKRIERKYKQIDALKEFYIKHNITNREREIIELIVAGKNNRQIEDLLFISIKTVNNHKHNIFKKLKINSSGDLKFLVNSIKMNKK